MNGPSHILKTFETMEDVAPVDWARVEAKDFPFADHEYLHALETSGAVSGKTGWAPLKLTAWHDDALTAASLLYVKNHSYGEYIFDWGWAQAYERHGVPYYPKVLSAIPFTPATGPKLLFSPDADRPAQAAELLTAAKQLTEKVGASSLHYLFLSAEEVPDFERAGFLIRHSFQYHWANPGYATFEAFLDTLKPRKRKQILKERTELAREGLTISRLTGEQLTEERAELFYGFYLSTIHKMGAIPYLTLEFYKAVFLTMRDHLVFFLAERNGVPVAGSLCYEKGHTLYGRYWGSGEEIRNLHFELCYYRPIEHAIEKGLRLFEAGAQGEHKVARGFLPARTLSAHWIRHPEFAKAIANFIDDEKASIATYFDSMKEHSPYRVLAP